MYYSLKKIASTEQKLLIGNKLWRYFEHFDFQGRCGKVKGRIMFVVELSLCIMAINIVLHVEEDCLPGTKVIDRKRKFWWFWPPRLLWQGQRWNNVRCRTQPLYYSYIHCITVWKRLAKRHKRYWSELVSSTDGQTDRLNNQ